VHIPLSLLKDSRAVPAIALTCNSSAVVVQPLKVTHEIVAECQLGVGFDVIQGVQPHARDTVHHPPLRLAVGVAAVVGEARDVPHLPCTVVANMCVYVRDARNTLLHLNTNAYTQTHSMFLPHLHRSPSCCPLEAGKTKYSLPRHRLTRALRTWFC
jgi:hypothetical protein